MTLPTLADAPEVLTVDESRALLRIGRDAAYALIHSGALRSVRIGRTIRVPRDAVLELLGYRENTPGGKP
jgi:excisionase family DNA binding protein